MNASSNTDFAFKPEYEYFDYFQMLSSARPVIQQKTSSHQRRWKMIKPLSFGGVTRESGDKGQ
jgi:hypothetical protein